MEQQNQRAGKEAFGKKEHWTASGTGRMRGCQSLSPLGLSLLSCKMGMGLSRRGLWLLPALRFWLRVRLRSPQRVPADSPEWGPAGVGTALFVSWTPLRCHSEGGGCGCGPFVRGLWPPTLRLPLDVCPSRASPGGCFLSPGLLLAGVGGPRWEQNRQPLGQRSCDPGIAGREAAE